MSPELRHLRYLLAVAEHGSFTRAAQELRVSQPTLSQQIRQLERAVGAQLLDRTGRTVRLTDAGAAYAHYAHRALRELAAAERAAADVKDLTRGTLRVAVTPTFTGYLVGPLVREAQTRHPGIALQVRELTQDHMEARLLADELDLAVGFEGARLAGVRAAPLYTESLSLVVGPGHEGLRQGQEPLPVRELASDDESRPGDGSTGHHLALLSTDFATRRHIDAYFARHGVRPRVAVETDSVQALTEIVQRTPLATVLPDAVTHDHPRLVPIPLDPPLPPRTVVLLRRENAYETAAAAAFRTVVRDVVRERGYPAG
ncbi:transcriptional regulator CynR [Streptantibioticus parmotrematis]|uniref:transcriptional regulator CynR n=1 Tax=Streptantibioticus parmotrematis TaxID=2873249 RepID=UPI0033C0D394